MRVILNDEVKNVGHRGDVKNVADGYARNFLIPKGMAYQETKANLARFAQEKKKYDVRQLKDKTAAEESAGSLRGLSVKVARKVGEQEVLYGSVTTADIAEALAAKGIELDKRKIVLADPIKRIGTFQIPIHLHKDVTVEITLDVVAE